MTGLIFKPCNHTLRSTPLPDSQEALLCVPFDGRLPLIGVRTRQTARVLGKVRPEDSIPT